jgi:hypothetical protein
MSDNILEIKEAKRELAKFVIGIIGQSGDGKTYTALQLAYGLANYDPSKIGLLDTENKRGSLYADVFKPKRFLSADLMPPFTTDRYIRAMREFAEHQIEVLIIDSITHSWEGTGGLEEYAWRPKKDGSERRTADWIGAKRNNKQMINTMLYLPFHVICCVRAREKMSFKDPAAPVSLGIQPICEKNLPYEMTLSFLLSNKGQTRKTLRGHIDLDPIIGDSGCLTAEHGLKLREWIGGFDPMEKMRSVLKLAASQGVEALKTAWKNIPARDQKALAEFKDTLKEVADTADLESYAIAEQAAQEKGEAWTN